MIRNAWRGQPQKKHRNHVGLVGRELFGIPVLARTSTEGELVMGDWSTWDEYVFTYTNQDDGVHIVHLACDTDVAEPEFLLPMAKAVVLIGEHAVRCPHRGRGTHP